MIIAPLKNHKKQQGEQRARQYRDLMRREAVIGGQLLGPVPVGTKREFFCLDKNTWIEHEEWKDAVGHHSTTTRYDIRPEGVLKICDGRGQVYLCLEEATSFYKAVSLYSSSVKAAIYAPTPA